MRGFFHPPKVGKEISEKIKILGTEGLRARVSGESKAQSQCSEQPPSARGVLGLTVSQGAAS